MKSKYQMIDTPNILIDYDTMIDNIKYLQSIANQNNVQLRPHTKTHKSPYIAKLQLAEGACGIAVAKVGEAEVMAKDGIKDIFIANEIVGKSKIERIAQLSKKINITFGIDSVYNINEIDSVFKKHGLVADVLIEIEIGEERSGVFEEDKFIELVNLINTKSHIKLKGIFSHDGHSYHAKSLDDLKEIYYTGQRFTLKFAELAEKLGNKLEVVSIGSTPPFMHNLPPMEGITEIRLGTYVFMDASQGNIIGTYDKCAATVLATVISKPTESRVITDSGAKALTSQSRSNGLCETVGKGFVKGSNGVTLDAVFDEHGIIINKDFRNSINIGDKIEIIPNHICPVCNLYDKMYLVNDGEIINEIPISARGKTQ